MTNNQLTDKRQEHGTSALTIGYYMCRCPECGWFGSSEDIHGDHEICDCPNCSTEVEDLDVGSLWNLVLPKLAELQERRNAERDSEPAAWLWSRDGDDERDVSLTPPDDDDDAADAIECGWTATPLYRHAQQPVVPDDVLVALQKVARIRLDLNDFDGDRRGIADCLGDAEEALIEVVNRRAAMLNGGKS